VTRPFPACVATAATVTILCLGLLFWYSRSKVSAPPPSSSVAALDVRAADASALDDFAPIGDISNYLNSSSPPDAPLKNISIQAEGDRLKLHGTIHKIFSLPIELVGSLAPTPDGRVQFQVTKLDVLKIPLKGLLGGFHVELSDLVHASNIPGVQIVDNDIIFDTQKLLAPAAHPRSTYLGAGEATGHRSHLRQRGQRRDQSCTVAQFSPSERGHD
jgi:hypothetical protein